MPPLSRVPGRKGTSSYPSLPPSPNPPSSPLAIPDHFCGLMIGFQKGSSALRVWMDGPGAGGRPRACVADLRRGATATARYTLSMKISFRRVDRTNYFRSEFGAIGRPRSGCRSDGGTGREVVTSKRLLPRSLFLRRRCRWRHNGLVIFRPFRGRFAAAAAIVPSSQSSLPHLTLHPSVQNMCAVRPPLLTSVIMSLDGQRGWDRCSFALSGGYERKVEICSVHWSRVMRRICLRVIGIRLPASL